GVIEDRIALLDTQSQRQIVGRLRQRLDQKAIDNQPGPTEKPGESDSADQIGQMPAPVGETDEDDRRQDDSEEPRTAAKRRDKAQPATETGEALAEGISIQFGPGGSRHRAISGPGSGGL